MKCAVRTLLVIIPLYEYKNFPSLSSVWIVNLATPNWSDITLSHAVIKRQKYDFWRINQSFGFWIPSQSYDQGKHLQGKSRQAPPRQAQNAILGENWQHDSKLGFMQVWPGGGGTPNILPTSSRDEAHKEVRDFLTILTRREAIEDHRRHCSAQ